MTRCFRLVQAEVDKRTQIVGQIEVSWTLVSILIVAVGLRVISALVQGNAVATLPGVFDQLSYDALARRVLGGYGFSFATPSWPLTQAGAPTAHWSFLYTLYLAAVYALVGPHPLAARLIQAVAVGILMPWFTWRLGRRLFSEPAGLVAAAISAIYVYFFYYAGALMTESFYIVGILWTLDCAIRIADSFAQGDIRWRRWLELGLAIGVTVLLRQLFLLFVPLLFLWLWWAARTSPPLANPPVPARGPHQGFNATQSKEIGLAHLKSLALGVSICMGVLFVMIVPWTLRNYQAFHRFVPLNTNSGFAFFWANHPIHGSSFIAILPSTGPSYQDLIPAELRTLDEAALDQALLREGVRFVLQDPARYLLLSLSRVKDYFMFWPSKESSQLSNISRLLSFALFLPFIVYGLFMARSLARKDGHAALMLILLFVVVYTAIHLFSWALIRYRLPVDAILILFAGLALSDLGRRIAKQSRPVAA